MRTRLVAGFMSGTSLDGLDGVLVRIHGKGLRQKVELIDQGRSGFGQAEAGLKALAGGQALTAETICSLARDHALAHVKILEKWHKHGPLDLVSVHGQTVFHRPPLSWQLCQPQIIAQAAGCPLVYDLRAADVALGGQGAPLTPLADWILFRHPRKHRVIVNLGGFCNITVLKAGGNPPEIVGADLCACNQILDAVAKEALKKPYDRGGKTALAGTPDKAASKKLLTLLHQQSRSKRSLGSGDECLHWIRTHRGLKPQDLAASAAQAVGQAIGSALEGADEAILAGGGTHNAALTAAIAAAAPNLLITPSSTHGVPEHLREAMAWAILGACSHDGIPIALPQVTGAKRPTISGTWVFP